MNEQPTAYTLSIPGTLADCRLVIPGTLPGLNEYIDATRINRQKGATMKRQAQTLVMWHMKAQLYKRHFTKPVFLLFTFYEKDRRRDHDNVSSFARKVIQDALVTGGALQDDGWAYVTGYLDRFAVDKGNPRIVVEFIEQEVETQCKRQRAKSSEK